MKDEVIGVFLSDGKKGDVVEAGLFTGGAGDKILIEKIIAHEKIISKRPEIKLSCIVCFNQECTCRC